MKALLTGAFRYTEEQICLLKQLGIEIIFQQDEKNINVQVKDIDIVVGNAIFLYNDISKFKNLTGGYCLPDFVYERAATVYAANGRTAEADAQATNIIKDASRGCFR